MDILCFKPQKTNFLDKNSILDKVLDISHIPRVNKSHQDKKMRNGIKII